MQSSTSVMTIPTDATAITTSGPTIAAGAKTAQSTALAPADFGPAAANTIASTTAASIVTASATTTATKSAAATVSDPAPTANPVLSFSTASSLPTDHAYSLNFYLNQSRSEDAIRIFNLPSRSMASVEPVTDPTVQSINPQCLPVEMDYCIDRYLNQDGEEDGVRSFRG